MKPGYKTTEFWLSLLGVAAGITLRYLGFISDDALGAILATTGIGYPVSRGLAKRAGLIEAPVSEPEVDRESAVKPELIIPNSDPPTGL